MQETVLDPNADTDNTAPEKTKVAGTAITFRPAEQLKKQLEQASEQSNQSINQWLTSHLTRYFSQNDDSTHKKLDLIIELLNGQEPLQKKPVNDAYDRQAYENLVTAQHKNRLEREQKEWEKSQETLRRLEQNRNGHYGLTSPISPANKTRCF